MYEKHLKNNFKVKCIQRIMIEIHDEQRQG